MNLTDQYLEFSEPNTAEHLWRYTPWRKIHPLGDVSKMPSEVILANAKLTFLDGTIPENIFFEECKFDRTPSKFEPDVSAAFVRAICNGVYHKLNIPKDIVLEQPLLLEITASGYVSAFHLVIESHPNSKFELITSLQGDTEWFGFLREGDLKNNANLSELFINQLNLNSTFLRSENFVLNTDAVMHSGTLSLGGLQSKSDIRALIKGNGVDYSQKIAMHGIEERNDDIHLRIHHTVGKSKSRVIAHTICDGSSKNTTTGKLIIEKSAQNTDAGQKFLNLLLSDKAKANSIPELEVLANDVLASHGASSAPINNNQLFYLKSRGLNIEEAKAMIIEGFLISTFDNFPSKKLIEWAQARLLVHLDCRLVA